VSVAPAVEPGALFRIRGVESPTNPVPPVPVALVVYMMVPALALAAIIKTATPVTEAAWIRQLSFISVLLNLLLYPAPM
jgi:hypothetical protein